MVGPAESGKGPRSSGLVATAPDWSFCGQWLLVDHRAGICGGLIRAEFCVPEARKNGTGGIIRTYAEFGLGSGGEATRFQRPVAPVQWSAPIQARNTPAQGGWAEIARLPLSGRTAAASDSSLPTRVLRVISCYLPLPDRHLKQTAGSERLAHFSSGPRVPAKALARRLQFE
jgi:hypothetical protein